MQPNSDTFNYIGGSTLKAPDERGSTLIAADERGSTLLAPDDRFVRYDRYSPSVDAPILMSESAFSIT